MNKKTNKKSLKRTPIFIISILFVLLILLLVFIRVFLPRGAQTSQANTQEGIAYLQALESVDPALIENDIKNVRKEERRQALENGSLSLWEQFYDYAIVGDSRALGFSDHQLLEQHRVLADKGAIISDVADVYLESLRNLNPGTIFLCFGLNDMVTNWSTVDDYIQEIDSIMALLKQQFPNGEIYLNSILPVTWPAFGTSEMWYNIPDWNAAIKAHCEEAGYHYIDNTQTVEAHADLYEGDGVHFTADFYQYWAINMLAEVNES